MKIIKNTYKFDSYLCFAYNEEDCKKLYFFLELILDIDYCSLIIYLVIETNKKQMRLYHTFWSPISFIALEI